MISFLPTLRHRAPLLLAGALLAMMAVPALAQAPAITATDRGLEVDLAGHRLTLPPPVWSVESAEPVQQAQTRFTNSRRASSRWCFSAPTRPT